MFLCDKLAYRREDTKSRGINFELPAAIIPFAQDEMVASFIEGIHPSYKKTMREYIRRFLVDEYPSMVVEALQGLSTKKKNELKEKLKEVGKTKSEEFWQSTKEYTSLRHVGPILEAVDVLPKDELAAMAEALVNITSIKRRITMEPETVGGPIDVAVISKKDGFIWIRRKHYFKPEYNYEFFADRGSDERVAP
jgi:hypothetical protein